MAEASTPATTERPTGIVIVTFIGLAAALLDVITGTAWLINREDLADAPVFLAWATLLIGLGAAALAALLFMGSKWARTLIAVFMGFHIVVHAWAWLVIGSEYAVAATIDILVATVVLFLLFSRESTEFLTAEQK
jgi:hypothetical protein